MDQLKIILQEPDADIRSVLQLILEENHYQVKALVNYEELTESIESFRPHLVLLDFRMLGRDAIKACVQIKLAYPHLPVIALSCNSHIAELYAVNGFDNYLSKPFDIDQLLRVIEAHTLVRQELTRSSTCFHHQE